MRDYYEFLDNRPHGMSEETVDNFVYGLGEDGPRAISRLNGEQKVVIESTLLVDCVTTGHLHELKPANFSTASLDLVEETLSKPATDPERVENKQECLRVFQEWRRS